MTGEREDGEDTTGETGGPEYHDVWETRVRFAETDAQGIVFYGNYVTYQDETMMAFMEALGYPYEDLVDAGWETHVVHVDVDYHSAARVAEELVCGTRVDAIRNSSIDFDWRCHRPDGTLVASGGLTHVAVDAETGETVRVPEGFREAVVGFQSTPPDPV